MLMADVVVGCTFMGFILHISADDRFKGQASSICALSGSSVHLPCSTDQPTSSLRWYTERWEDYKVNQHEVTADGNHVTYDMSDKRKVTLTIKDLTESDEDVYYCTENEDKTGNSWLRRVLLSVADLQVKVIPTSEGQTVTLMCTTSCPLTEQPAAYIWYKNSEFLYEDWSPWYQELVSSEAAVRYSCAVKGYEDLRSPEVSVDSVTSTCFFVTYAKGKMCHHQASVDKSCTITYPKEVHVHRIPAQGYVTLNCTTSCPLIGSQITYKWYQNRRLTTYTESQQLSVSSTSNKRYTCVIHDHDDLLSAEVCTKDKNCQTVNYKSRRICALPGSSVNISSQYSYPDNLQPKSKLWYKIRRRGSTMADELVQAGGRVEYHDSTRSHHILRIKNLMKHDSAEYIFRLEQHDGEQRQPDLPGVTLFITGLRVTFTPSAVVTEGQRVTLTCSTSCPLTDNTNYIWYLNDRALNRQAEQNKHLVLDPVSSQHAGNYSCAVKTNISSHKVTLTVQARDKSVVRINAGRVIAAFMILILLPLLCLWMRKKQTLTSTTEPNHRDHNMRTSHSWS